MAQTFIEKRKANWQRLEELIQRIRQLRGLQKFTRDEVRELGRLYRRAASDLAIARVESRDQRLVGYLNSLVIRAHGEIYRSESNGVRGILEFYRYDFPAIFRQTYRYTLAVFLIFLAMAVFSFVATYRDEDFSEHAYIPPALVQHVKENRMWTDDLNENAPVGAAAIMTNNIGVGLKTFAFSILPVAGTMLILMPTALQFGSLNALIVKYHMVQKLYGFVAGHGVLEFTAIFIAGGAGLMIGLAILVPGERTRAQALVERGAVAIKLLAGCIPILVIAGVIEAFISPTPIHPYYKFAVSLVTAIALAAYLLKPDRRDLLANVD
ncbi:MAG TPA: stage II sporulation protein M [Blastocatellia bacterium]|nr:stage II sporulation protein M [Blastocatellia bacterium]